MGSIIQANKCILCNPHPEDQIIQLLFLLVGTNSDEFKNAFFQLLL
jgi:hypothetical protein